MISDIIDDGIVYLICNECGARLRMLTYEVNEHYRFPIIDTQKSIEKMQSFNAQHLLCKPRDKQLELGMI